VAPPTLLAVKLCWTQALICLAASLPARRRLAESSSRMLGGG
jgi:hypothetical protein